MTPSNLRVWSAEKWAPANSAVLISMYQQNVAKMNMHTPPNWTTFYWALSLRGPDYLFIDSAMHELIQSLAVDSDAFWSLDLQVYIEGCASSEEVDLEMVLENWLEVVKLRMLETLDLMAGAADKREVDAIHFGPDRAGLKLELMRAMTCPQAD